MARVTGTVKENTEVRLIIPMLPPVTSSPNSRAHWFPKWENAQNYKNAVHWAAYEAKTPLLQMVEVSLTLVFARNGRHDPDNIWGRFKPGMDGLVSARVIPDDDSKHVKLGDITFEVDKKRSPMTIITVKEVKID